MSFSFENQGTMTFLVYAISEEDSVDSMSLGMLTNNRIPGLAPAIFTQMDATKYIKYNVSAKVSVKQLFEGQVNKKRLLGVFNGIVDAMLSAEEYMIDTSTILLDLDYIFADVSTCETILVCLPVEGKNSGVDLATFFKTIMFSTQFDQTENCDHVARIINYLNSSPVFSLVDFKGILDSLNNVAAPAPQPAPQPRVQPATPVQQPVPQPAPRPVVQTPPQPAVQQPVNPNPPQRPAQPQPPRMNVPGQQAPAPAISQPAGQPEKPMSFFGLMMHYSKENKAIYDAQKAAKKAAGNQSKPATPTPPKKQQQNPGFAIPGAPSNPGFAIPGQPAPQINQPAPQPQQPKQFVPQPAPQPAAPSVQQPAQPTYTPPAQPAYTPPVQPQGQSANFGETTILGGGGKIGETTVLGAGTTEVKAHPHLIRGKNNERINLDKPVFRIGKEKSYVDYFVSDNTAVSRSHCNIITRDGQYFIVDTNSTNHTYVNGGMIQSNVETPLSHGTKIRLANEDFEFRLY